jgi:hypothetical protein
MPAAMTTRERFHATIDGLPADRLPVVEWATWWDKTIDRWHGEGLPAALTDRYAISKHFGQDLWWQVWTQAVHWDSRWKESHHGAGMLSDCPSYDDLEPHVGRWPVLREQYEGGFALQRTGEAAVWFTFPGFFWGPRQIMGIERHLLSFHDEGELLHRINSRLADWMLRYLDELDTLGRPDFMTFAEDLSYNHGPMLSQKAFNTYLKPYYQRVIPALKERGIRVLIDSDGDITRCASWFLDAGIEGVLPLERQAGVDVMHLRSTQPELRLVGGFDKLTMPLGEEAMRQEVERLLPAMRSGRFLPSCDHQTPPGVSYAQYQTYMRLFHEYAQRAMS